MRHESLVYINIKRHLYQYKTKWVYSLYQYRDETWVYSLYQYTDETILKSMCVYVEIHVEIHTRTHTHPNTRSILWWFKNTCGSRVMYERDMSHVNVSCHVWMSHGTECEGGGQLIHPHIHATHRHTPDWYYHVLWHIRMSHVTYEWVISRVNVACHQLMSHGT